MRETTRAHVDGEHPGGGGPGAARAAEVVVLFEDTVLDVVHLVPPAPHRTAVTRALLALAALGGLVVLCCFGAGLSAARADRDSFERWTGAEHRDPASWRPHHRQGPLWDWAAAAGLSLSLASVTLLLARRQRGGARSRFRVGAGPETDLATIERPGGDVDVVAPRGQGFAVRAPAAVALERLLPGGQAQPVTTPDVLLAPGARYRIDLGGQQVLVGGVEPPRRQSGPAPVLDSRLVAFFAGSLLAHLLILALLRSLAGSQGVLPGDLDGPGDRLRLVSITPPVDPPHDRDDASAAGETGAAAALAGQPSSDARMALSSGQTRGAEPRSARAHHEGMPVGRPMTRQEAIELASHAGILPLLGPGGGPLSALSGTDDLVVGSDLTDLGPTLSGHQQGAAMGGWGTSVVGVATIGGTWGTLRSGRFDSLGAGDTGTLVGSSGPGGRLRRRLPAAPVVHVGPDVSIGDLDKTTIRRYIHRHLAEVRYCYERQLVVQPDLAGTLVAHFQISPRGVVQGARASGLGSAAVEGCVARVLGAIQFPKPGGGGLVSVTYPFTFQVAGR